MKKRFILGLVLCALSANMFADEELCTEYQSKTHNPGFGGTVSAVKSATDELEWTLTATPAEGYSFTGWNDGVLTETRTVNLDPVVRTITYTATFERIPCTHTVSAIAYTGGTANAVVINDCTCQYRITAVPATDYVFVGWDEDGDGSADGNTENPRDIYPYDADLVFYAVFANKACVNCDPTYDNPEIGGSVNAELSAGECNWTLTATPTDGYAFLKWMDGVFENPRVVAIDHTSEDETSFTAMFIKADVVIDGWSANDSVVVRTKKEDLSNTTATIYTNGTARVTGAALTRVDAGYWAIPVSIATINDHAGESLNIVFSCGGDPVSAIDSVVPYVIKADANISTLTIPANADVEVVRGTLTMDAASSKIAALDIYAGAKAVVPAEKNLSLDAIYMRGNAMAKKYPQLVANGSIANKSGKIYYDYALDYANFYPLAVPYAVECSGIQTHTGKQASFEVQWYDGEARAATGAGWKVFDDQADGARLDAGKGYIVFAVPYKWNGTRQSRVTVRFPMSADLAEGETEKKTAIGLYGNDGPIVSERNWNYLGNPYLANFTTSADNLMMTGHYDPSTSSPEIEQYEYVNDAARYITTTTDGFLCYEQRSAAESLVIKAFNTFFIQSALEGELTFSLAQRAQNSPRRTREEHTNREVAFSLLLNAADGMDHTGLLYGEQFTDEYEMNADLVKLSGSAPVVEFYSLSGTEKRAFNAQSLADITRPVSLGFRNVPVGEMTISFDAAHYDAMPLQAVILTDYEAGRMVNLLEEAYTFTSESTQSDSRFAVHALLAPFTATGIDEINGQMANDQMANGIYDLLGRRMKQDILPQGIYIVVENGQSRKVVIR